MTDPDRDLGLKLLRGIEALMRASDDPTYTWSAQDLRDLAIMGEVTGPRSIRLHDNLIKALGLLHPEWKADWN